MPTGYQIKNQEAAHYLTLQNPVRAGIVNSPEKYIYSSAADYNDEKGLLDAIKISLSWKTI
jgi:hypothetical protein